MKEAVKVLNFVVFLLFSYGFAHHYNGTHLSWKRIFFSYKQYKCVIQPYQICKNTCTLIKSHLYINVFIRMKFR